MTRFSVDRISVIVPVYDVAEYLHEFFEGLDAQGSWLPADIIFIDDGSTDDSAQLIEAWISRDRPTAKLIRTENRGVSAARNTGIDEASTPWILFVDPDDVLAPGYFEALTRFLGAHPDLDLVATNLLRLQEPDRRLRDNHPLRFRFSGGDRVAELEDDVFVMNAASVLFPLRAVRASRARFRTGLHASEDALFVAEYLLSLGRAPNAGFVANARYGYRKRQARTSAVDRYRADPSTYTVRFREGYVPLLEKTASEGGVPSWLQSMLLYEMQWLLAVQMDPSRYAENLDDAQRAETLTALRACLRYVSDDRLLRYDASALPLESRLLILALTDRPLWGWVGAYASMPRGWRRAAELLVYTSDTGPDTVAAATTVSWPPDYFGQQLLFAHRLRVDPRERHVVGRAVIWPRAGETPTQTQDRHRRFIAEGETSAIPSQEGEVYVQRLRPWADTSTHSKALHRAWRRRRIWSKDAVIGTLLRPGSLVLFEDDAEGRLAAVAQQMRVLANARLISPNGSVGSWRFGSIRHRIARARARMIVSAPQSIRPSARARLHAVRALVVTDGLQRSDLLSIRRLAPEFVVTADRADVARLSTIGIGPESVIVTEEATPESMAGALSTRRSTTRESRTDDPGDHGD